MASKSDVYSELESASKNWNLNEERCNLDIEHFISKFVTTFTKQVLLFSDHEEVTKIVFM